MATLSKVISGKTGYSEAECKQILLDKMDKGNRAYKSSIENNAMELNSWAAITTCYASSDPQVFIKAVGKKKNER